MLLVGDINPLLSLPCSIALVKFASRGDEQFVLVGTVKSLVLSPRSCAGGFIHCYQLAGGPGGEHRLELMHKTAVEELPGAIVPFQGRVLAGVGKFLRIYELGKKKLLRKCENKVKIQH
jgi:splicing factor 3B subunit 3